MRLVIFGATSGIGKHLVEQALAKDHRVTAIVRAPEKVTVQHANFKAVKGDVLAEETLEPVMEEQDAVLLVLGADNSREATTLYSQGARNVLHAMKAHGVQRFIGVSASGFINDPSDGTLVKYMFKPLLQRILKNLYDDLKRMEEEVKASSLDWTLVRPARLTDGAQTKSYRTALNRNVAGGASISRADVADYMLSHLEDPEVMRAAVAVAY